MRFEDTPNLFGDGCGVSTGGDFTCSVCGVEHNKGNDEDQNYSDDFIGVVEFAGMEICGNCFEDVENEILRRMNYIIPWYRRIIEARRERLDSADTALKSIGA
jgi:hypothetical protein